MTAPMIENWTHITGVVLASDLPGEVNGFTGVEIQVARCEPVEGFANLLQDAASEPLVVQMPSELVQSLAIQPTMEIDCRVRRAGRKRVFVHRQHIRCASA